MMKAVKQIFCSSLLLLGYGTEELIAHPCFKIKAGFFSGKERKVVKPSVFMHLILAVVFEYVIPNKTIPLSPLRGNAGELQKTDDYMVSQGKRETALHPAKVGIPGSAV